MFDSIWDLYFPIPESKNVTHPIAQQIIGIPKPDSLDESTIATDHLDQINDEINEGHE